MITTVSDNQHEIIKNITTLYLDGQPFELDPTFSKGNFYNVEGIERPKYVSDLESLGDFSADSARLPLPSNSIRSIMFDPPFIAGFTTGKKTGKIARRFSGFRYIPDLWEWYYQCLNEFSRVLTDKGVLVFKCQDTVSSHKQWLSHVYIINEASKAGFYTKDMFILTAKSRMIGHNHRNQKHARKFHSYFLVFIKGDGSLKATYPQRKDG